MQILAQDSYTPKELIKLDYITIVAYEEQISTLREWFSLASGNTMSIKRDEIIQDYPLDEGQAFYALYYPSPKSLNEIFKKKILDAEIQIKKNPEFSPDCAFDNTEIDLLLEINQKTILLNLEFINLFYKHLENITFRNPISEQNEGSESKLGIDKEDAKKKRTIVKCKGVLGVSHNRYGLIDRCRLCGKDFSKGLCYDKGPLTGMDISDVNSIFDELKDTLLQEWRKGGYCAKGLYSRIYDDLLKHIKTATLVSFFSQMLLEMNIALQSKAILDDPTTYYPCINAFEWIYEKASDICNTSLSTSTYRTEEEVCFPGHICISDTNRSNKKTYHYYFNDGAARWAIKLLYNKNTLQLIDVHTTMELPAYLRNFELLTASYENWKEVLKKCNCGTLPLALPQ